jgi:hypothetical protein
MHCDVCVCREPGSGAMGQPWTIQTGTLVSQVVALPGTVWSWTQLKLGVMPPVPTQGIMSVNCEQALLKYNMNAQ